MLAMTIASQAFPATAAGLTHTIASSSPDSARSMRGVINHWAMADAVSRSKIHVTAVAGFGGRMVRVASVAPDIALLNVVRRRR